MAPSKPVQPLGSSGVTVFVSTVVVSWVAAWIISQRVFHTPAGIVLTSVPFFFLLMAVEYFLGRGRFSTAGEYDISDSISSIGAGAVQQLGMVIISIGAKPLFRAVQDRFALFVLPESAWYTLPVAMVVYDLQYYLIHRCAATQRGLPPRHAMGPLLLSPPSPSAFSFLHECNLGWSFHQVHHSSDHYNLSSALRQVRRQHAPGRIAPQLTKPSPPRHALQSTGQYLFALWSPVVNALFLPFEAHFTAAACNTTYQFWVHSVVVHRLPSVIEFIFSTPAHHRVHHDRRVHKVCSLPRELTPFPHADSRPRASGQNYGGILIVWDRLFGTFLDEQGLMEGNYERELYGVLSAPATWNPLRVQFDHFLAVCRRAVRAPKMLLLGPGYRPKLRSTALPPLGPYSVRVRRKTLLSRPSAAYVTAHFAAIILAVRRTLPAAAPTPLLPPALTTLPSPPTGLLPPCHRPHPPLQTGGPRLSHLHPQPRLPLHRPRRALHGLDVGGFALRPHAGSLRYGVVEPRVCALLPYHLRYLHCVRFLRHLAGCSRICAQRHPRPRHSPAQHPSQAGVGHACWAGRDAQRPAGCCPSRWVRVPIHTSSSGRAASIALRERR